MAFSIRRLFSNLFLSVVIEGSECLFYGRVFKNGKVVKTLNAKFTEINPEQIDQKIIAYIKRQEDAYYAVYLSLFYNDSFQGALPTLNKEDLKKYNIKTQNVTLLNLKDFSIYADSLAIAKARDTFGKYSVDLLYSPISLMFYEITKRGASEGTAMYIYSFQNSSALSIFKQGQMKFATFFRIDSKSEGYSGVDNFAKEDITDIDNLIIKDEDEMSSLDDFRSLDDILGDSKKDDEFEDLGYDINMLASNDVDASVTIFGRDMNMYRYIKSAIKEFYANPLYEGDFIDEIIFFDNAKTSATFLQFLHTELLVKTTVHSVDILKDMNELMAREIVL